MDSLERCIRTYTGFKSLDHAENRLRVHFNGTANAGEINRFLFSNGIVLTHLSERKRSLEQHFLELLKDNQ
jgi:ABC-2 type transport system ATP-binding protein